MHDRIEHLKKLSRDAQIIAKAMNKYAQLAAEPIDNVYILEKQRIGLEKRIKALPEGSVKNELIEWCAQECERISGYKEEFRIQFGQKLSSLFKEKNIEVRGQYPLLRIGLYTLKIDFEFGEAILFFGPEIEKITSRILLHPQVIFDKLVQYDADVRVLKRSPEEYVTDLYQAYIRTLRVRQKAIGEKVLITDVLKTFVIMQQNKKFSADPQKKHYQEFSRIKLAYILYKIRQTNAMEHGLRFHVATFDATTDKLQSFWIPESELGEGTHYAMISFEKERDCTSA